MSEREHDWAPVDPDLYGSANEYDIFSLFMTTASCQDMFYSVKFYHCWYSIKLTMFQISCHNSGKTVKHDVKFNFQIFILLTEKVRAESALLYLHDWTVDIQSMTILLPLSVR